MPDHSCTYNYFNYYAHEDEQIETIAQKFHCEVSLLHELNPEPKKGAPLRIPCRNGGCVRGRFYVIQYGETLKDIAGKFHVSVERLLSANPYFNPNNYIIGQTIIVPINDLKPSGRVFDTVDYEIGRKENIGDLLRRFDMSVIELRDLNPGLDLFKLKEGDIIKIKEKKYDWPSGAGTFLYTVQSGENIGMIGEKFGVSVIDLLKCNPNIRPLEFSFGQRIQVPYK